MRLVRLLAVLACLAPTLAGAEFEHLLSWRVSPEPDVAGYRIYLRFPGTAFQALGRCASSDFCMDIESDYNGPTVSGYASFSLGGLNESVEYRIAMTAYDWAGNESELSNEITVGSGGSGTCSEGACDDGNPCTVDTCPSSGCAHDPVADGTNCGDQQTCFAGVCSPAPDPILLSQVSVSLPSPQPLGTTFALAASAAGGVAPLQYKWRVRADGVWSDLADWSPQSAIQWTPQVTGLQAISVWARSDGSVLDEPEGSGGAYFLSVGIVPLAPSLTSTLSSPQPAGQSITLTASAGIPGDFEYQWWIRPEPGAEWAVVEPWSSNPEFVWHEETPGTYGISAWIRPTGSASASPSAVLSADFHLLSGGEPLSFESLTSSPLSPQPPGTSITFTASASGGSGAYEYQWWVKPPSGTWVVRQSWSSSESFSWSDKAPGDYTIAVWLREAGSGIETLLGGGTLPFSLH